MGLCKYNNKNNHNAFHSSLPKEEDETEKPGAQFKNKKSLEYDDIRHKVNDGEIKNIENNNIKNNNKKLLNIF